MKKIKYFIVILFLMLLLPIRTNATELELTFENIGNSICADDQLAIPSYDNNGEVDGHIICSISDDLECTKYNLENEKLWVKIGAYNDYIDWNTIFEGDNEEITVNGESDIIIVEFSQDENATEPLWYTQYGGNNAENSIGVINSYNNAGIHDGYLLFATTYSTDLTGIKPGYIMVKFDLQGKKIWEKNLNSLFSYQVLGQNAFLVGFENYFFKGNESSTIWEKELDIYINKIIPSKTVDGTTDGYIIIGTGIPYAYNPNDFFECISSGDAEVSDGNLWNKTVIIKVDLNGNEVWRSTLNKYTEPALYDVIVSRTPTGEIDGYIAVGMGSFYEEKLPKRLDEYLVELPDPAVGVIIKFDLDGKIIWKKEHTEARMAFTTITENYDIHGNFNGYLITGKSYDGEVIENVDSCVTKQKVVKYTYKDYPIEKEVEKGGSVAVDTTAYPGEKVEIAITTEEGYILEKLVVLDEKGTEIEVTNNTFIMPEGEVTVKATFKRLTNPETASIGYTIVFIILVVSIATFTVKNQKLQVTED